MTYSQTVLALDNIAKLFLFTFFIKTNSVYSYWATLSFPRSVLCKMKYAKIFCDYSHKGPCVTKHFYDSFTNILEIVV